MRSPGRQDISLGATVVAVSMLTTGAAQAESAWPPRAEIRLASPCVRVLEVESPCALPRLDARAELLARLARAIRSLETGDAHAAVAQFRAIAAFYRRGGDRVSAEFADLQAARVLVSLERFDDALATLAGADAGGRRDAWAAEREHVRVIALEYLGEVRTARARLLAARSAFPAELWNDQLAADAERLGVAADGPFLARRVAAWILAIEWIGLLVLATIAWLRGARRAGGAQPRASVRIITDPQNEK